MKQSMLKKVFFICAAVATVSWAWIPSFAEEAAKTWDEKYKDEPYVILRSERTVELRKDFTTLTTIHKVIKIQKEGGKKLGEIPITYDKSREEVKDIQAFTITPDGEKLKYQEIQDLNPKKEYAIYSDERTKMVTMPHVVVGSTIEWQATIETRKPVIDKNFYDMVYLSAYYPVKAQKYTLSVPKGVELHIKYINNAGKPVVSPADDKVTYAWETVEREKIEQEEYMPSWDEVYDAVAISTLNSWEDLSKWTWDLFRKNMRLSDEMKKKVNEIVKDKVSQADKVQAIIEYIQEDFRYVSMDIDYHSYEPHPSDNIFSNKYGDCKDYTLLGMALLSEIGVKAYPVLYPSFRVLNGESLLPMPIYFDHAILFLEVGDKKYYSDLLRKGYYFYEVPEQMSGKKVFVANEKGGFFGAIPLMDEVEAASLIEEHTVIPDSGDPVAEMTVLFPRNASVGMREGFKSLPADTREKAFASLEASLTSGGKVTEKEWKNVDTSHANIIARLKFDDSHLVQRVGNMIIFGMPQQPRGSLFATPKRKHPIVFMHDSKEEKRVAYSIPEGYEIVNLPKEIVLERDFGGYERSYKVEGNSIIGKEVSTLKESRIPAAEYQKVRDFLDDITKKTNDMIMIRKKG